MSLGSTWTRLCRVLGAALLGVVVVSGFTPLPNALCRATVVPPRLEPAEAIVVLGSGVGPDGVLTPSSQRKAFEGILLYGRGLAPRLVLLGAQRREAEVRASLARELGVPADAILADGGVTTTKEEADLTTALLRPLAIRRILLVTGGHHMRRAKQLFEGRGFEVAPAPIAGTPCHMTNPEQRMAITVDVLQEFLARHYYRAAGFI